MLGFNKKPTNAINGTNDTPDSYYGQSAPTQGTGQEAQGAQIPYEIYEKVHEPTARRRRWAIRLVAALLAVTLLIFGGLALRDKLNADVPQTGVTNNNSSSGQNQQNQNAGTASQQDPQSNAPIQKTGADPLTTSQSDTTNTGTVSQPE